MEPRAQACEAQFPAETVQLARIRAFVRAACPQVPEAARDEVELAVDEACANIIEHAYPEAGGAIQLALEADPARLRITLCDQGLPFGDHAYQQPDLAAVMQLTPGGRGIYLMRCLMDEVSYAPGVPRGNRLTMVKYLA